MQSNTIEKFEPNKDLIISSYKFHALGVEPIGNPTFEDWESAFSFAKKSEQSVQFWVGDLINSIESSRYSDKYSQALDATEYSLGSLQNNKYVASKVPLENRRPELSFEAHKAVAPLSPEKQKEYLDKAVENGWTIKELRQEIGHPKLNSNKNQSLIELEMAAKKYCEVTEISREELGIIINDGEPKILMNGKFVKVDQKELNFMFR
jgi:hypothetical protein